MIYVIRTTMTEEEEEEHVDRREPGTNFLYSFGF